MLVVDEKVPSLLLLPIIFCHDLQDECIYFSQFRVTSPFQLYAPFFCFVVTACSTQI